MTEENQTPDSEEPSAYTHAEQEHYQAIRDEEREVARLEGDYQGKKESASAAKKRFESADAELRDFIRRGPDLQQRLPGMEEEGAKLNWRDVPLTEVVAPDLWRHFDEHDPKIVTLGDFAQFEKGYELTDLESVGPVKAEKMSNALEAFWAAHPEYCDELTEPDQVDDEPDSDAEEADTDQ